MPGERAPAHDRGDPRRRARAATASRMPRTARIGPIETTGFEGQITTASADPIASSTPGAGDAADDPFEADRLHVVAGAAPDPVLLEVQIELVPRGHDVEPRLDRAVRHRQDRDLDLEPRGDPRGHLRQRQAVRQRSCAEQVRRQVEVAEPEPRGVGVEGRELLGRSEGLASPAPPPLPIERVAEPVRDRVEVGTHAEAVHVDVVAGVHDRRDVGGRHRADESAQELPRTDTPCERDDLHERRA